MKFRSMQLLLNDNDDIIMGSGRLAIFKSIQRTGSINQTASELKMAYKTVWSKIKATEKNYGRKIVTADKQSGTQLNEEGIKLLEKYQELKQRCIRADDQIFEQIFLNTD